MNSDKAAKKKLRKKFARLRGELAAVNRRLDEWPDPAASEAFQVLSQDRLQQARRIDELGDAIRSLQENLSRQTNEGTALAACIRELEAYASELTQFRQEHAGRLTRLGQDVASAQQQNARLEKVTTAIGARNEAVEAKNEERERHDDARLVRLEAVEGAMQALRGQVGGLQDRNTELQASQQSAQQRLTTLGANHGEDRSHLDELRKRIEPLEAQLAGHAGQVEDLSAELASLSEGVQRLAIPDAHRRLDDLDTRNDRLEKSQGEHLQRLATLEKRNDGLDERLNTVIAGNEGLLDRIQTQNSAGEERDEKLRRLRAEFTESVGNARRQQEHLQGLEVRLSEWQQAQEEQAKALAARQLTQLTDTEDLQQRLKQRSVLGLVLLLLVAAMPLFLLLEPYMDGGEARLAEQTEAKVLQAQAADDSLALRKEVTGMRTEVARLGGALSELDRHVEELNAGVDPDLPAQVAELSDAVAALAREGRDRQQKSAGLLASQTQADVRLRALAADLGGVQERLARANLLETLAQAGKARQWAKAQQLGAYTLQLMGAYKRESLARFIRRHGLQSDSAIHVSEYRGKRWHVLLYGLFDSIAEARSAARELPEELAKQKPWVRQIPETDGLFPL